MAHTHKAWRLLLLFGIILSSTACQRKIHMNVGIENQKLKPCPESPNCIVSQYPSDTQHFLEPWHYSVSHKRFREKLLELLQETKRVHIEKQSEEYVHATFKIPVFGFVDDVEFYLPKIEQVVHYRSASRVGHSDLGVNKRRMDNIRKTLVRRGALEE